jgi:hypothetical protein
MITALVALMSVLLGCAVVIVIQLAIVIERLGSIAVDSTAQMMLLTQVKANTQSHLPPEDL